MQKLSLLYTRESQDDERRQPASRRPVVRRLDVKHPDASLKYDLRKQSIRSDSTTESALVAGGHS